MKRNRNPMKNWRILAKKSLESLHQELSSEASDNEFDEKIRKMPCHVASGNLQLPVENQTNDTEDTVQFLDSLDILNRPNSSSESDSTNDDSELKLTDKISTWAIENNLPRNTVTDLLHILHGSGIDVPLDARTIMHTPREIKYATKCGGNFIYLGIERGLQVFMKNNNVPSTNILKLNFSVDGIPLFKSSPLEVWPILCSSPLCPPFMVAVFCGKKKPGPIEDYLEEFIQEYKHLNLNGITINNVKYTIHANAFIAESSSIFSKCSSGHHACDRFTTKGE